MPKKRIYKVVFMNEGKVYEVYAKSVTQSGLFGFIEIEGLLFGQKSTVVIDPSEETLKNEFSGVSQFHIPMHSIVRIDEVAKRGAATIHKLDEKGEKVAVLPTPIYGPGKGDS